MRARHALPVVLLLALTGCQGGGSSGSAGSSAPLVVATGSPTVPLGDAKPRPTTAGTLDASQLASREREAILARRTVRIDARTSTGVSTTSVLRVGTQVEASVTTKGAVTTRIVILKGVPYLNPGKVVHGKHWLRLDGPAADATMDSLKVQLDLIQRQFDPEVMVDGLRGIQATAKPGPTVDGVPTVAYTYRLTDRQLVAALPAAARAKLGPGLTGVTTVTTEYLDAAWLPHREVQVTTTASGRRTTVTRTFTRWGSPVVITAPPASDVTTSLS